MDYLKITAASALVFVTACGGSSTGGATASGYEALTDAGAALALALEERASEGETFSDPANLPSSGTATFSGFAAYAEGGFDADIPDAASIVESSDVVSDFKMTANFGTDRVSATASRFFDVETERRLAGRVDMTGTIDRGANTLVEFTFNGGGTGSLTLADGAQASVDADLSGDFVGSGADSITGFIDANLTIGDDVTYVEGVFVAER